VNPRSYKTAQVRVGDLQRGDVVRFELPPAQGLRRWSNWLRVEHVEQRELSCTVRFNGTADHRFPTAYQLVELQVLEREVVSAGRQSRHP
jgi:hypothetical protein